MGKDIVKIIEFKVPPAKIMIRVGNKEQLSEFCKKHEIIEVEEYVHARSLWLQDENKFILLLRNDCELKIYELVHECKHLTNFIMESRQWKLDFNNDEPECYLLQEIFKRVYAIWEKI